MLCFTANAIKKERIAYITVHPFWCRDAREACLVDKGRTWHSTVGGLQFTCEMAALWVSTDRGALLRSGTQLHWGFLTPDPLQKQVVVMPSPAARVFHPPSSTMHMAGVWGEHRLCSPTLPQDVICQLLASVHQAPPGSNYGSGVWANLLLHAVRSLSL